MYSDVEMGENIEGSEVLLAIPTLKDVIDKTKTVIVLDGEVDI